MKDQENVCGLYIIGTPIGNMADLSARAKQIFEQVDWVAAEDTRETAKILQAYSMEKPLISLHEHSSAQKITQLIERLQAGERGAYVSDAGTPGISDPGAALTKACHLAGIRVIPIPGASAVTSLLSASGFSASRFEFHGFFPRETAEREEFCRVLEARGGVHVFFESPHRVKAMLAVVSQAFPDITMVMGRELTKKFETISFTTPRKLADFFAKEDPRGEFVFAVELPAPTEAKPTVNIMELFQQLVGLGANQKILVAVAKEFGLPKNEAYALALKALGK